MVTEELEVAEPTYSEQIEPDPERMEWEAQEEQWNAAADHVDRHCMPDPEGQTYVETTRQVSRFLGRCKRRSPGYEWYLAEDTHGVKRSVFGPFSVEHGYFAPDRIWGTFRAVGISTGKPVRHAEQVDNLNDPGIACLRIWDGSIDWVFVEDLLYDSQSDSSYSRNCIDTRWGQFLEETNIPVQPITEVWFGLQILGGLGTATQSQDSILWDEEAAVRIFLAMAPPATGRANWLKANASWVPYGVKRDYVQENILPPVPKQVSELARLKDDLTRETLGRKDKMTREAQANGMDLPTWFQDIVGRLERSDHSAVVYVRRLEDTGIINSGEAEGFFAGVVPVFFVGDCVLP